MTRSTHILLLTCLAAPAPSHGQETREPRAGQTVDAAKDDKTELCPVRWGKRPRRANGPGAEKYVAEWGPCKPSAGAVPASPNAALGAAASGDAPSVPR